MTDKIIHVPHAPDCYMVTSRWLAAPCSCGSTAALARHLAEQQQICRCQLVDVSVLGGEPEFVRGDSAGCPKHGRERDAAIAAAQQRAREA